LDRDGSGSRQSVIGMPDGIEVDPEGNGDLSHGGHLFTRFDLPRADSP
jgi:hypothetical protein